MKGIEILTNVKKTKENSCHVDVDLFMEQFRINTGTPYDYDQIKHRLIGYYYAKWLCTDTYVGGVAYLLDGQLVAASWRSGRKSYEKVSFISKEKALIVKSFLISMQEKAEDSFDLIEDLGEDWGEGYRIDYGSQILSDCTSNVKYKTSPDLVDVIKTYDDYKEIDQWRNVIVRCQRSGRISRVSTYDLTFPFVLNQGETS